MADIEALFEQLTNAYGPSGYEGPVRKIMREHLAPIADDIEVDGIGSIIARLDGTSESPRIMLAAHMDEVGALVRFVTDEGFVPKNSRPPATATDDSISFRSPFSPHRPGGIPMESTQPVPAVKRQTSFPMAASRA